MAADPALGVIDIRVPIDAGEAPYGYDDLDGRLAVEIALAGGGILTLVLPIDQARTWAGDLFAAVAVAYRETTADPHALTDVELAELGDPNGYDPGPGPLVTGDDHGPARVRFQALVDIEGACLNTPSLRTDIVEALARFNTTRVAVSTGEPLAGTVT